MSLLSWLQDRFSRLGAFRRPEEGSEFRGRSKNDESGEGGALRASPETDGSVPPGAGCEARSESPRSLPIPSKLIVGLGNPGPEYALTRHNIGFRVVESLAARHGGVWREDPNLHARLCSLEIAGVKVALLAPLTFMNRSGESVAAARARWPELGPAQDLLIVYDDLDLPTGRIRLRPKGGGGGHNGIGDILETLGTSEVPRLRFGIGRPGEGAAVLDWVLSPFSAEEESEVLPVAIEWAAEAVEASLVEGVNSAMSRFNAVRASS